LATLRHEPKAALVGGSSGLTALDDVIRGASAHLVRGGQLWFEHGFHQAEAVAGLLSAAGFAGIATRHDLAGQHSLHRRDAGRKIRLGLGPSAPLPDPLDRVENAAGRAESGRLRDECHTEIPTSGVA
jgi:release factor glutamine methyltransferase